MNHHFLYPANNIFDFLPFGEEMAAQHSQTADFETRYKFNGKELDQETGLYYYGARYYNPQTSIWLSVDPLVEKYPGINPYVYTYNNPIRFIDAFGMEGEENEWKPVVTKKGKVFYVEEKGDNVETLKSQYGLSDFAANAIYNTMDDAGVITGQDVAKYNGGNPVLKLDLDSPQATEQRIWDHFVFARDFSTGYSKTITKEGDLDKYSFLSTKFFSNTDYKNMVYGHATMAIDDKFVDLDYEIPFYRSGTFDNTGTAIRYSISPITSNRSPGGGTYYPHHQDYIISPIYNPSTGNNIGFYRILMHENNSNKLWHRLQRDIAPISPILYNSILKN